MSRSPRLSVLFGRLRLEGQRQRGPVARLLLAVLAVVLFIVAAVLGALIFVVVLGLITIVAIVVAIRVWWWRRKHGRSRANAVTGRPGGQRGETLEGDYRVLDRQHDRDRR